MKNDSEIESKQNKSQSIKVADNSDVGVSFEDIVKMRDEINRGYRKFVEKRPHMKNDAERFNSWPKYKNP